jgi:putative membrane protein
LIWGLSLAVPVLVVATIYGVPRSEVQAEPSLLATANACLNAVAASLLIIGYTFIKNRNYDAHRRCRIAAFGVSSLFLVSYLLHHARVGSVPFQGQGAIRMVYFALLIPHIVLAALIVPLALFTIYRGFTNRLAQHRRIARVTLPIWLYVSFSGVLIYFMLYYVG